MSLKVWWPLFPLLFLMVLVCLIMAMVRLGRKEKTRRWEWGVVIAAFITYSLTYAFAKWPWLHMPMSNISEIIMIFNVYHFFRKGWKDIAWFYIVALLAIACDFALHYILK